MRLTGVWDFYWWLGREDALKGSSLEYTRTQRLEKDNFVIGVGYRDDNEITMPPDYAVGDAGEPQLFDNEPY